MRAYALLWPVLLNKESFGLDLYAGLLCLLMGAPINAMNTVQI